jgi:hypothetical protein
MARPKQTAWRDDETILARLPEVERRHLRGDSNVAIADALGVAEVTIRRDIERIRKLWRERTGESIEDMKAAAVAELEDVRRRALHAAEFDERMERAVLLGEKIDDREVYRDDKGTRPARSLRPGRRRWTRPRSSALSLIRLLPPMPTARHSILLRWY